MPAFPSWFLCHHWPALWLWMQIIPFCWCNHNHTWRFFFSHLSYWRSKCINSFIGAIHLWQFSNVSRLSRLPHSTDLHLCSTLLKLWHPSKAHLTSSSSHLMMILETEHAADLGTGSCSSSSTTLPSSDPVHCWLCMFSNHGVGEDIPFWIIGSAHFCCNTTDRFWPVVIQVDTSLLGASFSACSEQTLGS